MREELERLLDDVTLLTLTFAIALGWSLYQLAHGIALFIDGLFNHLPPGSNGAYLTAVGTGASWVVGHRIVALDGVIIGLVELIAVLGAILLVLKLRKFD